VGRFYYKIFRQALADTPGLVSSNWLAILMSVVILGTVFLIKIQRQQSYREATTRREKLAAMRDQWKQNLRDSFLVTLAAWTLLFAMSLAKTLYTDHRDVTLEASTHEKERDAARDENGHLRNKVGELENEVRHLKESPAANRRDDSKQFATEAARRNIQKRLGELVNAGLSLQADWESSRQG